MGIFYPPGQTNDLSGNTIVVPASHMMLRTIARSDDQSFPWFAPAGTRRGLIDNANAIGFINSATGEFQVARLANYLRTQIQATALGFVFEPNDKITRDELKEQIEQIMNDLVAKRGIYDYLVVCDDTNNTPTRIDRNELYVDVAIEPVKAAEFIFIPIRLKNTGEIQAGNVASANAV